MQVTLRLHDGAPGASDPTEGAPGKRPSEWEAYLITQGQSLLGQLQGSPLVPTPQEGFAQPGADQCV